MPIPTHNIQCVTKAFKTKCPDCSHPVFYFSCNCGSKVFFEELGHPWEIHVCRSFLLREMIEFLRISENLSDDEIWQRIVNHERRSGQQVPDSILEMLELELGRRKYPFQLIAVDISEYPDDMEAIGGLVMEVDRKFSFFNEFRIDPENPLTAGLLGHFGETNFDKITLREKPDKTNRCREFKVLTTRKGNKMQKNSRVLLGSEKRNNFRKTILDNY